MPSLQVHDPFSGTHIYRVFLISPENEYGGAIHLTGNSEKAVRTYLLYFQ